ncbi:MAG: SH3 domain-containing C40 family peptidase [Eubacteriales bacterium]
MKIRVNKIAITALATGVAITSFPITTYAQTASSVLPAAGLALVLEDGTSLNDLKPGVEVPIEPQKVTDSRIIEKKVAEKAEKEYFSSLVIADVNGYVNIRNSPDAEEGEIVGKLYDDSVGELIEVTEDGWYLMKSGTVTGYVKAEYVVTGEDAVDLAKEVGLRWATVDTTTLFVREDASADAPILGMIPFEDQLIVLEEVDGWAKVTMEEGEGYASMDFLTLHTEFVEAESAEEERARLEKEEEERRVANEAAAAIQAEREAQAAATAAANATTIQQESAPVEQVATPAPVATASGSGMGSSVANFALQFVGNPYVYGGTSLTNGTDCSGFVQSVYKNFGVSLPRTSSSQRSAGYDVGGIGNAQPGDIICYSGHVGIYIGNGSIVHASTARTGIIVSNASYKTILSVRRIF